VIGLATDDAGGKSPRGCDGLAIGRWERAAAIGKWWPIVHQIAARCVVGIRTAIDLVSARPAASRQTELPAARGGAPATPHRASEVRPGRCRNGLDRLHEPHAPVAQLDRALPSEGKGHRFDSYRVRHLRTKPRTFPFAFCLPAMTACRTSLLPMIRTAWSSTSTASTIERI
jgi:hypothetical protein